MVDDNIREILDRKFGEGTLSNDNVNYALPCPFCNEKRPDKKKLVVHLIDLKYHCWVCESKGKNILEIVFANKKKAQDFKENLDKFNDLFEFEDLNETDKNSDIYLPKNIVALHKSSHDPDVAAVTRYLKKRGIDQTDIMRWRMMASPYGSLSRRVIIPSFDCNGNINYYTARTIDEINDKNFKYKNAFVNKYDIIFNEADILWDKTIILVEGVFDALKCPDNTVPLLGSFLKKGSRLFQRLIENQSDIIIALDSDVKNKAFKIAYELSIANCNVRLCFPPTGYDFGSLEKDDVKKILDDALEYNFDLKMRHKINNIKSGSII
jgi:DNA primase